jgi:hypothetical protein
MSDEFTGQDHEHVRRAHARLFTRLAESTDPIVISEYEAFLASETHTTGLELDF